MPLKSGKSFPENDNPDYYLYSNKPFIFPRCLSLFLEKYSHPSFFFIESFILIFFLLLSWVFLMTCLAELVFSDLRFCIFNAGPYFSPLILFLLSVPPLIPTFYIVPHRDFAWNWKCASSFNNPMKSYMYTYMYTCHFSTKLLYRMISFAQSSYYIVFHLEKLLK